MCHYEARSIEITAKPASTWQLRHTHAMQHEVTQTQVRRAPVTVRTVALLHILTDYISNWEDGEHGEMSPKLRHTLLNTLLAAVDQLGASSTGSFADLLPHLRVDGYAVRLVGRMRDMTCPDSLVDFLSEIGGMILDMVEAGSGETSGSLERSSVLAVFVRTASISYQCMSFSQVSSLCNQIQAAVASTRDDCDNDDRGQADKDKDKNKGKDIDAKEADDPGAVVQSAVAHDASMSQPHKLFLRYLEALRGRDFQSALDLHHAYFDSPGVHSGRQGGQFHLAALNLAALYYVFGHFDSAVLALDDAIRMAQQRNAHETLAFAQAWRQQIGWEAGGSDVTPASKEELLRRLIRRADMLSLPGLEASTALAQARETHSLSRIWLCLQRAHTLAHRHAMLETQARSLVLRASEWGQLGVAELQSVYAQLTLRSFAEAADPETRAGALCVLAQVHAGRGDEDKALDFLASALHLQRQCVGRDVLRVTGLLRLRASLRRGAIRRASYLADQLISITTDCEDASVLLARIDLLIATDELETAYDLAERVAALAEGEDAAMPASAQCHPERAVVRALAQLAMADVHLAAGNTRGALPPVLACLADAEADEARVPFRVAASLRLVQVQLALGYADQAMTLIHSVYAPALQRCSVSVVAEVNLAYAQCILASAGVSSGSARDTEDSVDATAAASALVYLHKASAGFEVVKHYTARLRVLALTARVASWAGDCDAADAAQTAWERTVRVVRLCASRSTAENSSIADPEEQQSERQFLAVLDGMP